MKVAILTCVNDRPHISPLIFECYKRLRLKYDVSLIVGYTSNADSVMLSAWQSDDHVHAVGPIENRTGKKFNEVLRYALQSSSDFGRFLIMGDDDSISSEGYLKLWMEGWRLYAGFNENAYVDCRLGTAMMHKYTCASKLIGAGRMITRKALEGVVYKQEIVLRKDYDDGHTVIKKNERRMVSKSVAEYMHCYGYAKPIGELQYEGLWPDRYRQSLDHASELKLVMHGVVPYAIPFDGRIHVTDFKTPEHNIWPYSILESKCAKMSYEDATWFLSDEEKHIIEKLRK